MINTEHTEGAFIPEIQASILDAYTWPNRNLQWRPLLEAWSKIDLRPFLGTYRLRKDGPVTKITESHHHLQFQDTSMPVPMQLLCPHSLHPGQRPGYCYHYF